MTQLSSPDSQLKQPGDFVATEVSDAGLFPVVGIGASAGGLEALNLLLPQVPGDTGMAFVVVQHLDPVHESRLPDILAKATKMPVMEPRHGTVVAPGHVYVIPPNTTITIKGGVLNLTARENSPGPHLPIDHFLKSLATDRNTAAVGVILSGSGSDGTLGMEEIKAAGGITIAQDEQSARFPTMPQSAMRSGCVDLVLRPDDIGRELVRISRHPYVAHPKGDTSEIVPPTNDQNYQKVLALLRAEVGVDFRSYRDSTIRRRIERRMVLHMKDNLAAYIDFLQEQPSEVEELYQDILINVTSFFREPEAFEALKEFVFPEVLSRRSGGGPLRMWVPGCSSGQEAYTLAMVAIEYLDQKNLHVPIQIFATDLSEKSLQKARDGVYPENIEAEISASRLRRFFTKTDGKYQINKSLRDLCVFARQNVVADPPFSRVDIISCRNLLIYLSPQLQKRVIPTFHYALNANGYLLLGASESIGGFGDIFTQVDHGHRIYAKKATAVRQYPHFTVNDVGGPASIATRLTPPSVSSPADWQREADRVVLGDYAPNGVVVNANFDVLQFRGHTDLYLTPPPGEASFSLLKMARDGLFLDLRTALTECVQTNVEVRRQHVRVTAADGRTIDVDLRVLPLHLPGQDERCYLVLFDRPSDTRTATIDAQTPDKTQRRNGGWLQRLLGAGTTEVTPPKVPEPAADAEVLHLRQEITSTREFLQSVIEQQDAANEELKSANEEILSSNEELQSTNEELETAKEELQSVNEELTTINEQLQNRNVELSRLADDFSNLLGSANVPMIVLGVDMRIRRFTPAAAKLLNLLPADTGRPISNIKTAIELPELENLVAKVVETVQLEEREVRSQQGRWYLLRICPYRTAENKIDGAVVVLMDIHEMKSQAARLRHQAELMELSQDSVIVRDARTDLITSWNRGAHKMYGWSDQEALGKKSHLLLQTVTPAGPLNVDGILERDGFWEGEVIYTHKDGPQDDCGKPAGAAARARD
jgi:two-component system CheB/CheR fusion protein